MKHITAFPICKAKKSPEITWAWTRQGVKYLDNELSATGFTFTLTDVTDPDAPRLIQTVENTGSGLTLPKGEREILRLVALSLLQAVCPAYRYAETALTAECGGHSFTVKGKTVLDMGWKAYASKEPSEGAVLPEDITEGQSLSINAAQVKEGQTSPPKHFTEDTILASMETAGVEDMPEDVERKGIGTPATRAGILEKLVSAGFVERKKSKKITHLMPTQFPFGV